MHFGSSSLPVSEVVNNFSMFDFLQYVQTWREDMAVQCKSWQGLGGLGIAQRCGKGGGHGAIKHNLLLNVGYLVLFLLPTSL